MKRSKIIPWLLALMLFPWSVAGCAAGNVDPSHTRANTGSVDFHADALDDLSWQVGGLDESTGKCPVVISKPKPLPGGVLRLAFTPGRQDLGVTILNHVISAPGKVDVEICDGLITPVRVVLVPDGTAQVQTKEMRVGKSVNGYSGRKNKIGSDEFDTCRVSATAESPMPHQPLERNVYAHLTSMVWIPGRLSPKNRMARGNKVLRLIAAMSIWCLLGLVTLWATAALYFDVRISWLRIPLAALYILGMLAGWIWIRRPWKAAVTAAGFLIILTWWLSLQPSNQRDWLPDMKVLPHADINGNQVVIHGIRDCDYRTETDYDVHHYERTFNLDELRTVDLFLVTWGSPDIAHTMVSFGFTNGDYVCFSIETRKEKGEEYSALKGFFRQFELTYVIADERDVVRLRTNYRNGEEVCLYRLRATPQQARKLFLDYLRRANELYEHAEWYNALTDNCTTAIRTQRAAADRAPWDWRMLLNGHLDELLYERGAIVTNLPFAELKKLSNINTRAKAADQAVDFSEQIRIGVPGFHDEPPAN